MSEEQPQADVQPVFRLLNIAEAEELLGLHKDPDNLREHNKRNMEEIEGSVDEVGYNRGIAAAADGRITAGNGTFEVAKKRNAKVIIVDVNDPDTLVITRRLDLTDERLIHRAGLRDNRASDLSRMDKKAIARLVEKNPEQMLLDGVYSPKEQDNLLKAQADALELAKGGTDEAVEGAEAAAPNRESAIRMVQLFCSSEEGFHNHGDFVRMMRQVQSRLLMPEGTANAGKPPENITDTVIVAMRYVHGLLCPPESAVTVEPAAEGFNEADIRALQDANGENEPPFPLDAAKVERDVASQVGVNPDEPGLSLL